MSKLPENIRKIIIYTTTPSIKALARYSQWREETKKVQLSKRKQRIFLDSLHREGEGWKRQKDGSGAGSRGTKSRILFSSAPSLIFFLFSSQCAPYQLFGTIQSVFPIAFCWWFYAMGQFNVKCSWLSTIFSKAIADACYIAVILLLVLSIKCSDAQVP